MKVKGVIRNGVVVLEGEFRPPEGAEVHVEFEAPEPPGEWVRKYAGVASDLPADAGRNLDHYLYGHSKQ